MEVQIIGICGKSDSGKSAVANVLVTEHGFVEVALADPIKRAVMEWYGFTEKQLWGPSHLRNIADPLRAGGKSPRYVLQQLGTEFGRHIYEDVWVDCAIRVVGELARTEETVVGLGRRRVYAYTPVGGLFQFSGHTYAPPAKGVVIPDVRFRNEVDAIRNAGGHIWKLVRPGLESKDTHVSETEQDTIPSMMFSRVIVNDGTLEDLKEKVRP